MSQRHWKTLLFTATLCVFAGAAAAQTPQTSQAPQTEPPRAANEQGASRLAVAPLIVADAPNARLAALVRRDVVLLRNKGVSSVTRIATGVYCILPTAASGIVATTAIVTLTPEYYYSLLNEIKVQWAATGSGCGGKRIAVYTFADPNRNGIYVLSNAVSFSIVVP